jgi:hypothetical protein
MSLQNILSSENLSFLIPFVLITSFFLTAAALVLFIEAAIMLRTLILGRVRAWHYALLGLPLGASILCYVVAMAGLQAYSDLENFPTGAHITPTLWYELLAVRYNFLPLSIVGLLQVILAIALFLLTLFLEKKLLPRVNQPPLWTVVRRQRVV